MGHTVAEKILAEKCGRDEVSPGEFINARVDLVLASELSGIVAIEEFEKIEGARIFDPDKVVLVMDHFTPAKDIESAEIVKRCRAFAREHGVRFYDVGRAGIQHVLLPEKGLVAPGDLIEAGAKTGIIPADAKTKEFIESRSNPPGRAYQSDPDAEYAAHYDFDVTQFEPFVAVPFLPENVKPVSEVAGLEIDQVVIGMCTNGNLEDLRAAASLLKGRKIHPRLRTVIIPGSQQVYLDAMREGLIEIFIEANCSVSTPTCGPCLGGHMGVLAEGERCVSTSNRNFRGRMGHRDSEVYLVNPYVAAATAIAGTLSSPAEFVAEVA
jgi:homoaconitase/3-isopropylmalate dehydratase large subunit